MLQSSNMYCGPASVVLVEYDGSFVPSCVLTESRLTVCLWVDIICLIRSLIRELSYATENYDMVAGTWKTSGGYFVLPEVYSVASRLCYCLWYVDESSQSGS